MWNKSNYLKRIRDIPVGCIFICPELIFEVGYNGSDIIIEPGVELTWKIDNRNGSSGEDDLYVRKPRKWFKWLPNRKWKKLCLYRLCYGRWLFLDREVEYT
jgi:hypothetical protein